MGVSGNLWIVVKDVKPLVLYDADRGMVMDSMWRGGSLMGFLVWQQAPRVYSRVTTGMPILNGSLFSEVRTPL